MDNLVGSCVGVNMARFVLVVGNYTFQCAAGPAGSILGGWLAETQ